MMEQPSNTHKQCLLKTTSPVRLAQIVASPQAKWRAPARHVAPSLVGLGHASNKQEVGHLNTNTTLSHIKAEPMRHPRNLIGPFGLILAFSASGLAQRSATPPILP